MEEKNLNPEEQSAPEFNEKDIVRLNYENNMLKDRLKQAYAAIEELSNTRGIERMKFLFLITENKNNVFSPVIVSKAASEIVESMFQPAEPKNE